MFALTPFERKSYDLFNAFHDFERDFFGEERQVNSCKTDIRDEGERFVLEAELPGFDKKDITLKFESGYVTISAKKQATGEDGRYIRRERATSYSRSYYMGDVDEKQIKAKYENGVLTITIPKEKPEEKKHNIIID